MRTAPEVPPALRDPEILFLGSTDPGVQARVLGQAGAPGRVVLDTMSHWIRDSRRDLEATLPSVDVLLLNQEEVRLLGEAPDEEAAARSVLSMGPTWVIVKRGARGACAYHAHGRVEMEAVPVELVVDPTGAGDAFAGGLVASLTGVGSLSPAVIRNAVGVGVDMGARAVRAFSLEGLLGREGGSATAATRA